MGLPFPLGYPIPCTSVPCTCILGDDWSRGQCVAARRSSGIDVALSSSDIISAEFHRINSLIIVSLRSLEGLSDNALVC